MAVKATVLIRPKEGILDPQGEAVENALPALGFSGVSHVHVGRLVELEIEDDSQLVKDARSRAFNDAKDRAEQYAQLSGLDLGKVISISESGNGSAPTPMFRADAAAAPVPVAGGELGLSAMVTVFYQIVE